MKIYLAARYTRHPEMQQHATDLVELGHTITSRWIWGSHNLVENEVRDTQPQEEKARFAFEDLTDVEAADTLIFFSEEPRTATRGARHVEMGIALAHGKRIMIVGGRENIFHELPSPDVEHYDEWTDVWVQLYNEWQKEYYGRTSRPEEIATGLRTPLPPMIDLDCPPDLELPWDNNTPAKDDEDKLPYHLMSPHALREYAEVLRHEAVEHGERNWEGGLEYSRLYGAALRHIQVWWAGEDLDNGPGGTGRIHLAGALFSIACLIHYELNNMHDCDDRPYTSDPEVYYDVMREFHKEAQLEFEWEPPERT